MHSSPEAHRDSRNALVPSLHDTHSDRVPADPRSAILLKSQVFLALCGNLTYDGARETMTADQRSNQSPAQAATILVVDDEASIVKLCRALLETEGFHVLEAEGSSEALKTCANHKGSIDLLLTDLVLPPPGFQLSSISNQFPHVNGYQLAVLAAKTRSALRIILMSGNPDKELASHGIKRGSLPFVAKPFGKDDLINTVREVLTQPAPALTRSGTNQSGNDVEWFG